MVAMDTGKLLQILLLVEADENDLLIQSVLDEVSNLVSQPNSDSGSQALVKADELLGNIKTSRAYEFGGTEVEVLDELGGKNYYGEGLVKSVNRILNSRSFEIPGKIKEFSQRRNDVNNRLNRLKDSLTDAGIVAYEQEVPEIALVLPDDQLSLDSVNKHLSDFSKLIKSIQEANRENGSVEQVKITRLSRGSGEFFFGVDYQTAQTMLNVLSNLANVYLAANQLRKSKNHDTDGLLTKDQKEELEKLFDRFAKNKLEEFIQKVPDLVKKNLEPEKANNIRKYVKFLFKWLPLGIHVEVVYDKRVERTSTEEKTKKELTEASQRSELQKGVSEMYRLPKEQLKLPEPDEADKNK